jgi:hypothetical protein
MSFTFKATNHPVSIQGGTFYSMAGDMNVFGYVSGPSPRTRESQIYKPSIDNESMTISLYTPISSICFTNLECKTFF